jgi:hypothetical protein
MNSEHSTGQQIPELLYERRTKRTAFLNSLRVLRCCLLRALSLSSGAVLLARPTPRLPCFRLRRAYLQANTAG